MKNHNNMKYLATHAALLLIGVVVGIFADPYLPAAISNSQKGYQTGFAAARTLVENSSIGNFFKTPEDQRSFSGTVTSLEGDRIGLHLSVTNPFGDQSLNDRVVLVTANTKVVRITQPTQSTKDKTAVSRLPIEESVSPSDIKIGDALSVVAEEDIKTLKEFVAYKILILPKTVAP